VTIRSEEGIKSASARDALERRFAARVEAHGELRWLASFAGNREEPVHRWFPYKEGFSRGLVDGLLDRFDLPHGATVLDPFCGVGTTPLAARLRGFTSFGIDLLPLATFVSTVKLRTREELPMRDLSRAALSLPEAAAPEPVSQFAGIPLVRRAFDPSTARSILLLRDGIRSVPDRKVREFLLLALLASLEELSHTQKDGLCVRVRTRSQVADARDVVRGRARAMLQDLETQDLSVGPPARARIYSLELALEFVESFPELRDLRHSLLRGHIEARPAATSRVDRGAVPEVLEALRGRQLNNPNIPRMIHAYFEDMYDVVGELARVCRRGARVGLLVGNVRFGGEMIPVDLILGEMAEARGFRVERVEVTRLKGNASQQMGRFGRLPARESLSIWTRGPGT